MKKNPDWIKLLLVGFASAFVAVSMYAWMNPAKPTSILQLQSAASATPRLAGYAPEGTVDFVTAANAALPAVVHVKTTADRGSLARRGADMDDLFRDFFGRRAPDTQDEDNGNNGNNGPRELQVASGSGVILSADGYIITNNHVISQGDKITVTFDDNRTFEAKIIGTDPTTDLALLKIDVKNLSFLKFANSDEVKVGEWVLAVGNPFDLTSTVTAGIVSAKGRAIGVIQNRLSIESFIQTDAAVNPGNSGGALINTKGELIGVNTAIASQSGTFTGYSFAIPSNIVTKVVDDLMNYGEVQRGLLGVLIQGVSADLNEEKGLGTTQGVYIGGVNEHSAAQEAGLQVGDVITSVDGQPVNTPSQLQERIGRHRPGDKVRISYLRSKAQKETYVTLKNSAGTTVVRRADPADASRVLGSTLRKFDLAGDDKEIAKRLKIDAGVVVESLAPGRLRNAGIREGFIITSINDQPVREPADVTNVLKSRLSSGKASIMIEGIYPDGRTAVIGVPLPQESTGPDSGK